VRAAIVVVSVLTLFACSRRAGPQNGALETPSSDATPPDASADVPDTPDAGPPRDSGSGRMRASLCDVDGWCWESPLPQGNWLSAVAAAGSTQIWFGGWNGALFRWTQAGFEGTLGEVTKDEIIGLHARGTDDVWAATPSALLHFDGSAWSTAYDVTAVPHVQFRALFGAIDGTIFVAGWASGGGFVSLFDGTGWRDTYLPSANSVYQLWAHDKSDAYAITSGGAILHWNGEFWASEYTGDALPVGIWGSDRNDVWAVGGGGTIVHRDSGGWRIVQPATPTGSNVSMGYGVVVGSGPSDVWAIGSRTVWQRASGCTGEEGLLSHWDGVHWAAVQVDWNKGNCYLRSSVLRAGASAGGKIWFAGDQGVIAVADASGVTRISSVPDIHAIWGPSPDRIYATSGSQILRRDETGWVPHRTADPTYALDALHGNATDFVATTQSRFGAVHFSADGASSATWEFLGGTSQYLGDARAVWMTEDGQAFITGRPDGNLAPNVLHWNGAQWSSAKLSGDAGLAMFATSLTDVWAGGSNGNVFRFDGQQWRDLRNASEGLMNVAGFWRDAGGSIVSAGSNATHAFARWDGKAWQAMDAPVPVKYAQSVWTAGPDDVWILGEAVEEPQQWRLYHLHGGQIEDARVKPPFTYSRVFGIRDDAWIYGPAGAAIRRRFTAR
jgi:hypothetical protein